MEGPHLANALSSEDERMNNLLLEARLLENTYNELSSRQNMLERLLIETRGSLDTIKEVGSAKTEEALIPVGAGVLLRASPPRIDKVLVGIGANVVVEKSRDEAEKIIEARAKNIEENMIAVLTQRNQIAQRLEADRRALQSYVEKQQAMQEQQQQQQQRQPAQLRR